MNRIFPTVFLLILLCSFASSAQLAVTVSSPKIVGQKAIIALAMTNNLAESVQSARAICFLLDEQGKMIGQSAKWVIGGEKDRPALSSKAGTTYNFVITSPQPFTNTNLIVKVDFSNLIVDDGKVMNVKQHVKIITKNTLGD